MAGVCRFDPEHGNVEMYLRDPLLMLVRMIGLSWSPFVAPLPIPEESIHLLPLLKSTAMTPVP